MIDPVLKSAIESTILLEYDEIYESAEDKDIQFSEDFEKKMDRLIRRRRRPYYSLINTFGKRVACIVLAFITVMFTTVMSVEALRTPFLGFITGIFSDHSEIKAYTESDDVYPDRIIDKYDITFDMSGFEKVVISDDDISRFIKYTNGGITVDFSQDIVNGYSLYLNTEDATTEHIDINGHEAIGSLDNHGYYSLIWNNGKYIIEIASNIGKDALIQIAKSVQKVEY